MRVAREGVGKCAVLTAELEASPRLVEFSAQAPFFSVYSVLLRLRLVSSERRKRFFLIKPDSGFNSVYSTNSGSYRSDRFTACPVVRIRSHARGRIT